MILLGTFFSVGSLEHVPRTTVVQIATPNYGGGMDAHERTRKTCEKMGELYRYSLTTEMPDGTKLVMTCIPDSDVLLEQ